MHEFPKMQPTCCTISQALVKAKKKVLMDLNAQVKTGSLDQPNSNVSQSVGYSQIGSHVEGSNNGATTICFSSTAIGTLAMFFCLAACLILNN